MASAADDAASAADAASATDGAGAEKPLYGRLMRAIHTRHSIANAIRFFKLPLIFTDVRLWAGAIAQFWWLTRTLEERLRALSDDPLVAHVAAAGLKDLAPGRRPR